MNETSGEEILSNTHLARRHPLVGHRHETGLPEQHLLLLFLVSEGRFGRRLQLVRWRGERRRRGRNTRQHGGEEGLREILNEGNKKLNSYLCLHINSAEKNLHRTETEQFVDESA